MEENSNQISTETTRVQDEYLWISKIDLEYAYGQLKLFKETKAHCSFAITGGTLKGYYGFRKRIIRFIRYPEFIPRKNRQNIEVPNTCMARR